MAANVGKVLCTCRRNLFDIVLPLYPSGPPRGPLVAFNDSLTAPQLIPHTVKF